MSSELDQTLDIPLPPTDSEPVVATAAVTPTSTSTPVGVATPFKGSFTTPLPTTLTTPTLYDPQAAAYYQAYHTAYSAVATQSLGYPYFVPVVPIAPMQQQQQHHHHQHQNASVAKLGYLGQQMAISGQLGKAIDQQNGTGGADEDEEEDGSEEDPTVESGKKGPKVNNTLPIWGNEKTMNLNPLILTNIQNSPYFKVNLFGLKTYHEVIDEIWYEVKHLEPWEKGSRRVGGQTGMCGSVRGVGAGGIVSTPFCILYKLFTLRLTRKQVVGLLKHKDSPYIRAIGLMYIRYTQPPENLWPWFEDYLDDEEDLDVKAGGGQRMTIGQIARHMLTKLDWFSTLFPRIPVPIQKDIEKKMNDYEARNGQKRRKEKPVEEGEVVEEEEEDVGHASHGHPDNYGGSKRWSSGNKEKRRRSRSNSASRGRSRHSRSRSRERRRRSRSRSRDRYRKGDSKRRNH